MNPVNLHFLMMHLEVRRLPLAVAAADHVMDLGRASAADHARQLRHAGHVCLALADTRGRHRRRLEAERRAAGEVRHAAPATGPNSASYRTASGSVRKTPALRQCADMASR